MKHMNVVKKYLTPVLAAGSLMLANTAMAAADYSAITDAADWSTVATAIITVFAAAALVIVAFVGGKFLLRAIRGA